MTKLAIFPAVTGLVGIYLGLKGLTQLGGAKASESWRATSGIIEHSAIERSRAGGSILYRPDIRYRYKVGGREYEGTRVFFGSDQRQPSTLDISGELVQRFPAGMSVQVWANPVKHDQAVLVRGETRVAKHNLLMAFAWTSMSLIFLYGLLFA